MVGKEGMLMYRLCAASLVRCIDRSFTGNRYENTNEARRNFRRLQSVLSDAVEQPLKF